MLKINLQLRDSETHTTSLIETESLYRIGVPLFLFSAHIKHKLKTERQFEYSLNDLNDVIVSSTNYSIIHVNPFAMT